MKFYIACVLYTLHHASECWALIEKDLARLDAFDMRFQCKSLRVVWSQSITNSSIRSRTKQPHLTAVIRKCRLQWFGHLQRMDVDRIPKKLCFWKPSHGKRRPKTSWHEVIQRDISKLDMGWTEEETEVAARESIHLSSQAANAEMHDTNQLVSKS